MVVLGGGGGGSYERGTPVAHPREPNSDFSFLDFRLSRVGFDPVGAISGGKWLKRVELRPGVGRLRRARGDSKRQRRRRIFLDATFAKNMTIVVFVWFYN